MGSIERQIDAMERRQDDHLTIETVGQWLEESPIMNTLVDVAAAAMQVRRDGFTSELSNRRLAAELDRLAKVRRDPMDAVRAADPVEDA